MRIGIYGGSFSPVHNGHVAAARAFMEQMWLDVLYIMPAGIPPHKQMEGDANPWQRLKMCELAFEGIDGVLISDLEIRREGKSYTVDTLRAMASEEHRLFLLMGTDMLLTLDTWREPEEIFRLCYPVYMRREAADPILDARIVAKISEYQQKYGKVVRRIVGDPIAVSSTAVRKAVAAGKDISGMVPSAVEKYIRENGLYKKEGGVAQ
ncbi:MAG: nicotinate (nicotinamide) nucleotide adenylyltransferase [Ruminococcaceae bacterium]|nr:nicotinate (nicotinamide) nucleotide adenylyltransferase [Oscillospiraceae bacterium]